MPVIFFETPDCSSQYESETIVISQEYQYVDWGLFRLRQTQSRILSAMLPPGVYAELEVNDGSGEQVFELLGAMDESGNGLLCQQIEDPAADSSPDDDRQWSLTVYRYIP